MKGQNNSAQKPRRVLHCVARMSPGGIENWLMSLLRKTDRNVLQMDFCVSKSGKGAYEEEILSLGSKIIRCDLKPAYSYPHRLGRVLKENQYDVVHSHGWLFSGIVLKVAHDCNVPVRVSSSHTTRDKYSTTLYRKLYGRVMRYLIRKHATNCLGCCKDAAAALFGSDWDQRDNCGLLYYGIELDKYRPGQKPPITKAQFGIPDDARVVGHVGSFRMAKNHVFLLEIAAEIIKREPDTWFFLAGDGQLRPQIEVRAEELGIKKQIIFAGNRSDIPHLFMYIFDVLLFPSIYEGLPVTLLEASAAGSPVVCSDVISNETGEPLPEAFTRVSLEQPASEWAQAVIAAIEKGKIPHEHAYDQIVKSHFTADYSLRELCNIYGC